MTLRSRLNDWLFGQIHGKSLVFNDCREDPRVDRITLDGEVYHVDSLAEDMVAVWIEIPSHEMALPGTFAINPNVSNEPIDDAAREAEIAALFEMGARDVDVGFHSDDVSVNFPMDAVRVDREFAEQAVRYLMALKRKSLAKSD